jgi:hypothetical protein
MKTNALVRVSSLAFGALMFVANLAQAAEVTVAKVTTDLIKNSSGALIPAFIKVVTNDDGTITTIKYDGTSPETGAPTSQSWPVSAIRTGIVPINPSETMGKKAVILISKNFDAKNGSPVTLDYLSSAGLLGDKRGRLQLELDRNGADWDLLVNDKAGRRKITAMHFVARKFMGKPVGVERIETK